MIEQTTTILTINSGSSSLKFALFQLEQSAILRFAGRLERIGLKTGFFQIKDGAGKPLIEQRRNVSDHDAALLLLFEWLENASIRQSLDAVGHRVVHGGNRYTRPHLLSPELVASLRELMPITPEHLPHELKAINAVSRAYPNLPQVACFDTAFHRTMPAIAQMYALPRDLAQEGVLRYGFHGLSYEFIVSDLKRLAGADADRRVIVAHLGNGASMAAIRHGQSVDTTMGFTPTGGLVMSTRSGDLDPGVVLYLLRQKGLDADRVARLVNEQGGLLGVSGLSADMRDLLARETQEPHAAEAVALFCRQARKHAGALAAVLGGVDTLVFTGGIGENSPVVRWRICEDLAFLGIHVDSDRNEKNAAVISTDGSPVTVRVMKTNEELMIAQHTRDLLRKTSQSGISE